MFPELGNFSLAIALALSLLTAVLPLFGAQRGDVRLMSSARPLTQGVFVFVAFALFCQIQSFVLNDFSVLNVATNSNSSLPLEYRIAAAWGSHEGSLLLWMFMLSLWALAVSVFSRRLPLDMVARVLAVLGWIAVGFLAFMLASSNPFDRLLPAAVDGRDLNPLLQDPGMIFHPPMLYMGYVGFSVAFAFAIAALIGGRLDAAWARAVRPWTLVAWIFLTLGIALGSYWAYYELGWGGWWFWDPVENASFMPWLVGTALIHSLAVTEKRGAFKSWTVLLAIAAFSLSLLGTFLVRSGVLTSVHAFATDPERGVFILALLVFVIGSSLLLFAIRAPAVGLGGGFALLSRETSLLANNVLLAVATSAVLLGTLYPLFLDALGMGKISVGVPYFNAVFVPLMTPVLFLMAIGPFVRWKKDDAPGLVVRLRWAFAVSVAATIAMIVLSGRMDAMLGLGAFTAVWIVASSLQLFVERVKVRNGQGNWLERARALPGGWWGMWLAHVGVAVTVVGITLVKGFEQNADLKMAPGQSATLAGYTFTFQGAVEHAGPNYDAARGLIEVTRDGRPVATLHPEKRLYRVSQMPMTEAAIDSGFTRDVYVSMGEPLPDSPAWIVRIFYKPFVNWIWFGALIMSIGGLIAAADRRYRKLAQRDARRATAGDGPATPVREQHA
ncbi:heme lyase CcmF/NrfE family subunit [Methyloversatilis thermotolerans]|uniref:heme lyase CcmF/NrfE family subunit n=1 Tax=Methyloversatilis thermotolerans TaxID=1346290 RepID=UPI0003817528|nr:heme lyase CcmF/NrfE family subunit [Methyloversatilis thermotolerans]